MSLPSLSPFLLVSVLDVAGGAGRGGGESRVPCYNSEQGCTVDLAHEGRRSPSPSLPRLLPHLYPAQARANRGRQGAPRSGGCLRQPRDGASGRRRQALWECD